MGNKNYFLVAGSVFAFAGLLHLYRSINSLTLEMNGVPVPLWVSYILVIITGVMAFYSFGLMKKAK